MIGGITLKAATSPWSLSTSRSRFPKAICAACRDCTSFMSRACAEAVGNERVWLRRGIRYKNSRGDTDRQKTWSVKTTCDTLREQKPI